MRSTAVSGPRGGGRGGGRADGGGRGGAVRVAPAPLPPAVRVAPAALPPAVHAAVLERELPLLQRAVVRAQGYASWAAFVHALSDAPRHSSLAIALSVLGHKYPFRALPSVEGLFVLEREVTMAAQL
jgi:hypothetical protein